MVFNDFEIDLWVDGIGGDKSQVVEERFYKVVMAGTATFDKNHTDLNIRALQCFIVASWRCSLFTNIKPFCLAMPQRCKDRGKIIHSPSLNRIVDVIKRCSHLILFLTLPLSSSKRYLCGNILMCMINLWEVNIVSNNRLQYSFPPNHHKIIESNYLRK